MNEYTANLYPRRREWALCYRNKLLIRGQNTNNISEATMKVIKDYILGLQSEFILWRIQEYGALIQSLLSYTQKMFSLPLMKPIFFCLDNN